MARILVLVLLPVLLIPPVLYGQIKLQQYTSATDTFYWKRYEHLAPPGPLRTQTFASKGSDKTIDRFRLIFRDDFPWLSADSVTPLPLKDWKKHLYTGDIDHSGDPDIIYTGPSDIPNTRMTRLYLGQNDSFMLIFEDYQYISGWKKLNGRLESFQTAGPDPALPEAISTRDYKIQWEENSPSVVRGRQVMWYRYTERPLKLLPAPVLFESVADTMMLRASAAVLNEPFIPALGSFGNIVAKYREKARGEILAEKKDKYGIRWYFVEIWPGTRPYASVLPTSGSSPVFLRGWVTGNSARITSQGAGRNQ